MTNRRAIAFGNPVYDEIITPEMSTSGRVLSGCSVNACLALTHLGWNTLVVGSAGPDRYEQVLSDCAQYRLGAAIRCGQETGGFRLIYDAAGDRTLDVLGVAEAITSLPADMAADAIIIGPILQETPYALIAAIRQTTTAPLFLDPQGLLRYLAPGGRIIHTPGEALAAIAPHCRLVKANEFETRIITGIAPRQAGDAAARALHALGGEIAIVTLAEYGSIIHDGTQTIRVPAYATRARDPTGAGDTYLAGFIHAYLQQPDDLYAAGCYGAAVASIWIEGTGPATPVDLPEVERRWQTLLARE